jgi:hypothetical protein
MHRRGTDYHINARGCQIFLGQIYQNGKMY